MATLDKTSVAVKRFHKALMTYVGPGENVHLKNFKTECERLKELNYPNVVRYIGAYEDKIGPLLVMAQELMYESLEAYLSFSWKSLTIMFVAKVSYDYCRGARRKFTVGTHTVTNIAQSQNGYSSTVFEVSKNSVLDQ